MTAENLYSREKELPADKLRIIVDNIFCFFPRKRQESNTNPFRKLGTHRFLINNSELYETYYTNKDFRETFFIRHTERRSGLVNCYCLFRDTRGPITPDSQFLSVSARKGAAGGILYNTPAAVNQFVDFMGNFGIINFLEKKDLLKQLK